MPFQADTNFFNTCQPPLRCLLASAWLAKQMQSVSAHYSAFARSRCSADTAKARLATTEHVAGSVCTPLGQLQLPPGTCQTPPGRGETAAADSFLARQAIAETQQAWLILTCSANPAVSGEGSGLPRALASKHWGQSCDLSTGAPTRGSGSLGLHLGKWEPRQVFQTKAITYRGQLVYTAAAG